MYIVAEDTAHEWEVEFEAQAAYLESEYDCSPSTALIEIRPDRYLCVVPRDGKLAAWGVWWPGKKAAVYVRPAHRKQGIGRELVLWLLTLGFDPNTDNYTEAGFALMESVVGK